MKHQTFGFQPTAGKSRDHLGLLQHRHRLWLPIFAYKDFGCSGHGLMPFANDTHFGLGRAIWVLLRGVALRPGARWRNVDVGIRPGPREGSSILNIDLVVMTAAVAGQRFEKTR
jgi:hypothetical protein